MNTLKIIHTEQSAGSLLIEVGGNWSFTDSSPDARANTFALLESPSIQEIRLRQKDLHTWDSSLLVFLVRIVQTAETRKLVVHNELESGLTRLIKLSFAVKRQEGSERKKESEGFLAQIGSRVLASVPALANFLEFIGEILISLGKCLIGKATMRQKDFLQALHECSVQALPIIAITSTLFGLILAFVGAVQLTQFGAQIYVAGLVGIGMLRVMGAIMVGIVMSGRVGASYAAMLGTMQVNEEIDALTTLGISPVEFLVLPRILALVIMVPLLTVYADCMGMLGGFLVGVAMLNITPLEYIHATTSMVSYSHGIIGLVYAIMFGFVIAIAGCYQGIRCGRSAQAVGQATTTAVVHSIVGIIVMTAIITVICNVLHI
ncbi:MAG: ABC transporter permease [Desulfovibrionaceae bacterium]|nr:ABC transporter permease [Desulfovibrionaceae bacterium]